MAKEEESAEKNVETPPDTDDAPKGEDAPTASSTETDKMSTQDATEMEARAIAQAMASADASYIPSPSLLSREDSGPLLSQVDGPSLLNYVSSPSVYQAKAVPVALRVKVDVPIHVVAGGSIVDYEISTANYDIGFCITAEREEGVTNVKESSRVDSHLAPVKGKFLVGSVPCALVFSFDNEYSWFRDKSLSYKITVTPPAPENVAKGRRMRAQKALQVVKKDKEEVDESFEKISNERAGLEAEILKLEKELAEKKESLDTASKEEASLEKRRNVRGEQIKMLTERLEKGWEDEKADA